MQVIKLKIQSYQNDKTDKSKAYTGLCCSIEVPYTFSTKLEDVISTELIINNKRTMYIIKYINIIYTNFRIHSVNTVDKTFRLNLFVFWVGDGVEKSLNEEVQNTSNINILQ
jgi:hypothetical protein